jgi:aspartate aminotransferase-like enzyme
MGDHPILFIPGPTEVDPELLQIMARPLVGHRESGFVAEVQAVCTRLKSLFATEAHAIFETCPATALMEAAIRNLVPREGPVLHLTCGAFGERWAKISDLCGRRPDTLAVEWGKAHTAPLLREKLLTSPPFEAVCITHNETSTGALEPLQELAAVVHELSPSTLVLVDAVTSLAGAELRFDAWHLDLAFAGTQKCLALPPGLTVFALSERALERARTVEERGFLFDFPRTVKETEAGKTLATPCVPLVFALRAQLDRVLREGLEARWARHGQMRELTMAWAQQHDVQPFVAQPPHRSPTVSCLQASGRDVEAMAKRALAQGFKMDKGYGDLKGKSFRIGHMGDHTPARLQRLLATLA